ncbi:hypothetical protein BSR55_03455 [Acinetobacter bereziniae]|nr:hypothetical protein BSR55_03455 [Acinetobacter bereziniae]
MNDHCDLYKVPVLVSKRESRLIAYFLFFDVKNFKSCQTSLMIKWIYIRDKIMIFIRATYT